MLEVNPIYLILLAEGIGLLGLVLLILLAIFWYKRRQKCAVIANLASRLKSGSVERRQKTELFLQAAYNFEGDELRDATQAIELRETEFLQRVIAVLYRMNEEQMQLLDLSLETMIESYKDLKPRVAEDSTMDPLMRQVEDLLEQNERLREDLSVTKNSMSQMVAEFAEMFAGGHDHDLSLEQVLARVTENKPGLEFVESDAEVQK